MLICLVLYRMILNRLKKLYININEGDTTFTLERSESAEIIGRDSKSGFYIFIPTPICTKL